MTSDRYHLLHAEVLETLKGLPDGLVDLGITSPPYNQASSPSAQQHPNSSRGSKLDWQGYEDDEDALPEEQYQIQQILVLAQLHRVIAEHGSLYYVHKDRLWDGRVINPFEWLRHTPWLVRQVIIWDRCGAYRFDGWHYAPRHEYVFWLTKSKRMRNLGAAKRYGSIWRIPIERDPVHPAVFPVELARRCVEGSGVPGGLLLDPYCGSGRAGVAAMRYGMRFLGIDRKDKYLERARELLDEAVAAPTVFNLEEWSQLMRQRMELQSSV